MCSLRMHWGTLRSKQMIILIPMLNLEGQLAIGIFSLLSCAFFDSASFFHLCRFVSSCLRWNFLLSLTSTRHFRNQTPSQKPVSQTTARLHSWRQIGAKNVATIVLIGYYSRVVSYMANENTSSIYKQLMPLFTLFAVISVSKWWTKSLESEFSAMVLEGK